MGNKSNKNAARNLTQDEINLVVQSTGLTDEQVVDWHQQFLIEFPNGFLNKSQYLDLFKQYDLLKSFLNVFYNQPLINAENTDMESQKSLHSSRFLHSTKMAMEK